MGKKLAHTSARSHPRGGSDAAKTRLPQFKKKHEIFTENTSKSGSHCPHAKATRSTRQVAKYNDMKCWVSAFCAFLGRSCAPNWNSWLQPSKQRLKTKTKGVCFSEVAAGLAVNLAGHHQPNISAHMQEKLNLPLQKTPLQRGNTSSQKERKNTPERRHSTPKGRKQIKWRNLAAEAQNNSNQAKANSIR